MNDQPDMMETINETPPMIWGSLGGGGKLMFGRN